LIDAAIGCLICLLWGTLARHGWAWWGGLLFFSLATLSVLLTLGGADYAEILSVLAFPERELEFLDGIPIHSMHLAIMLGLPLLLTIGTIVRARPEFGADWP
jgi:hypothetical protein